MRIPIGIGAFDPANPFNSHFESFTALVDTGATRTCVIQNVVDRLSLARRGRIEIRNVSGAALHWTYLFQVAIWPVSDDGSPQAPFGLEEPIEGADLGDGRLFDVLLGMDILERGALKMDTKGNFELAFP
jgi:predicted aspartyl protease